MLAAMGACLGVFLLDEVVVSVALPSIRAELGISTLVAHWVVNVYLLALAGLAAAAGRLADVVGAKILLIVGLVLFGGSSALGGFAQTGQELIIARLVQGIGAALIFPVSTFLVTVNFPPEERGKALGIYGAIGTGLMALGPFIGGALTDLLNWRWIFWVNPPIVIAIAVIAWAAWQDPKRKEEHSFDLLGLILLVCGLGLTVFAVMEGPDRGWQKFVTIIPLAVGFLLLVVFVLAERRTKVPLIAVRLFGDPSFAAYNLTVFTAQFVKIALFVFGARFFQDELGLSPMISGLALLPAVVPQVALATYAGALTDRLGPRLPSMLGLLGALIGTLILAIGIQSENLVLVGAGLLIWGLSVPLLFVPPRRAVMSAVPAEMGGQAGGILTSCQLLGGTMGMALCSTIFSMTHSLPAVFWGTAVVALVVLLFGVVFFQRQSLHEQS